MKYRPFLFFLCIIFCILVQSCSTNRNLVYFSNLADSNIYSQEINNQLHPKIQPGDALSIKVSTLNPQSNILYNSGSVPTVSSGLSNANQSGTGLPSGVSNSAVLKEGYIVNGDGSINFPVLGKVVLSGLTREEAQDKIAQLISQTDKGAIVNLSIQNFKITVIGEVTRPGSFNIPNNKINVLEALGMAGDMTPYAVRGNVLVIRESNGEREMQRLNLNKKEVFNSPFFYLKQNDIVYVQPENELKAKQANPGRFQFWSLLISSLSTLALSIYYISHSN